MLPASLLRNDDRAPTASGVRSNPPRLGPVSLVDSAIVRLLPAVPRPVVRKISERYIAGEQLDDALRLVRRLNDQGKLATIDVLGEEIAEPDESRAIAAAHRGGLEGDERGA